ncbi:MAG TPA: hypothetical protein VM925_13660 [Labilithrix sp.]|nr:hypothetical protein [Labilithrix sp.]
MFRFIRVSIPFALLVACNGEIKVGTVAPAGEMSAVSATPPTNPAVSCPAGGLELLYDAGKHGEAIYDFFSDGEHVIAGINSAEYDYSGSSRIVSLPDISTLTSEIHGSVVQLARTRDQIIVGVQEDSSMPRIGFVPRTGGPGEWRPHNFFYMLVASHPERDDGVVSDMGESDNHVVFSWRPPAAPTRAIELPPSQGVRSLSASATSIVATLRDSTGAVDRIVRARGVDGGQYDVVVDLGPSIVSNVVADGDASIIATYDEEDREIVVSRFEGVGKAPGDGVKLGSVTQVARPTAWLELEGTDVYLAYAAQQMPCANPKCLTNLEVVRFKNDADAGASGSTRLKTFRGGAPMVHRSRPFDVDACWLIWYDAEKRALYRQPKADL